MSVNSKMTAIADKIRELSGTTGAMGLDAMATHVGNANDNVSTEADLIAQISSALEGKAAGGGSGGSGGSTPDSIIKTCTIEIDTSGLSMGSIYDVYCVVSHDDYIQGEYYMIDGTVTTIPNVVVGTYIVFVSNMASIYSSDSEIVETINHPSTMSTISVYLNSNFASPEIVQLKTFDAV